ELNEATILGRCLQLFSHLCSPTNPVTDAPGWDHELFVGRLAEFRLRMNDPHSDVMRNLERGKPDMCGVSTTNCGMQWNDIGAGRKSNACRRSRSSRVAPEVCPLRYANRKR